ncbi:HK97 family phage prohead protease [Ornithobacterium rhinotracheale]|uniref:HK97 family phage prohead protease n=1 Tax=Ornithobacterium rhinotracheale TaxID=28251 RepID=UPI001FF1EF4E|nr:HK97 family phage prohead protease [Ornithobacterium rhinotracheale]MCK0200649.1 HK97 family phage prohead protease [Ornithobacterium rhinotracheale]
MKFILNDERVTNSYGFRVKTAGINLKRFLSNPVCLNNHRNNTKDVLGSWEDVSVEEHLLTATPKFDTEDVDGKEVVRKVERGVLKGCSMGFTFNPKDMVMENGVLTLTKCELTEASICAIPSNAASVVLYNQNGDTLSEQEIKAICLQAENEYIKTKNEMKELTAHLQLEENANESAILNAVKSIEAKLTASETEKVALKAEIEALKKVETERQTATLTAEVEKAVKAGKLDEAGKAPILAMPYEGAMALLAALPERKSITAQLKDNESKLAKFDKMTWDELDKGNHLAMLKAEHPEYFAERKKQQFGTN